MSELKDIEKIPIDSIKLFRETGESRVIPKKLQRYILHLDRAIELFKFEGNISRAAQMLMDDFDDLHNIRTAMKRVSDAINYFNLSTNVKNAAWDQFYADRLENLHRVAVASDNITEARRCLEKAHHYRTLRNDDDIDDGEKQIVHVLSTDVSLLNVVGKEFNLKKMWTDTEEFIDNVKLNERDARRVKMEAAENLGVDVEFEEISDDHDGN